MPSSITFQSTPDLTLNSAPLLNTITKSVSHCTDKAHGIFLAVASRAAMAAGKLIREQYEKPHQITMKGAVDLVTETDVASEALIVALLAEETPGIPVMTEEADDSHTLKADLMWVVDPLDGTTNFAHGFPFFAVSIALLERGRPVVGVVYAPVLDEIFWAIRGGGSWRNEQRVHVTDTDRLIEALIGTGFPYAIEETLPGVLRQLQSILPKVRDIRRAGAAALDLAFVACGRLDGFYEINLKPWDTAAGWLLVVEAGGLVSTFSGAPYAPSIPEIAASNGALHQHLLTLLR